MFTCTRWTEANTGKQLYTKNCIRCHNANPTKPGSIGPELFTTPYNVFHGKITQGVYPPEYTPKRKTKIMPKFKLLTKEETTAISKYIKEFK
jgi:mono/diheme cytochrome c family protein